MTESAIDTAMVTGLSDTVTLPETGGVVDVFVNVQITGDSLGLFGFSISILSDNGGSFLDVDPDPGVEQGIRFDIPFLDEPGRMSSFIGMPTPLPQERLIAGNRLVSDQGQFYQSFTSQFAPKDGDQGLPTAVSQISVTNTVLGTGEDLQTYGIGKLGQGQSVGPTILGRCRFSAPPLSAGETSKEYHLAISFAGSSSSVVVYQPNPVFPVVTASSAIESASSRMAVPMTINVARLCDTAADCDDGSECTTDVCDGLTGTCMNMQTMCSDGNTCTQDVCNPDSGGCEFPPLNCNDGNVCTVDTCDADFGCLNTPIDCDDQNECTTDVCNPDTGACQHLPVNCSDDNECSITSCDPAIGCVIEMLDCDDDDACTRDSCNDADGQCINNPITCNDDDPCTEDVCEPAVGCVFMPIDCSDNLFCNGVEMCDGGECMPGISPCNAGATCDEDNDVCLNDDGTAAAGLDIIETDDETVIFENGESDTISIALSVQPAGEVLVVLGFDEDLVDVSPSLFPFTADNYDEPQFATLTAVDNLNSTGDRDSMLEFVTSSVDPVYNSLPDRQLSFTIIDDEGSNQSPGDDPGTPNDNENDNGGGTKDNSDDPGIGQPTPNNNENENDNSNNDMDMDPNMMCGSCGAIGGANMLMMAGGFFTLHVIRRKKYPTTS